MANFNAIQIGELIKALRMGGTAEQVAQRTGYAVNTVYRYLRTWHQQGVVYIASWRKTDTKRQTAVWELKTCDSQHDAPKPVGMTSKERSAQYMQRKAQQMAEDMFLDMKHARR